MENPTSTEFSSFSVCCLLPFAIEPGILTERIGTLALGSRAVRRILRGTDDLLDHRLGDLLLQHLKCR